MRIARPAGLPWLLLAAMAAIAVTAALVVTSATGSSHREAPLTSLDPTGDDTDLYAYTADDAPGALTVVANWIPLEDPAGGPNFFKFDKRAEYYINIDNTGDGNYDIRYRFEFDDKIVNPNSFLYAFPGVASIQDPKLNVQQTYDVVREVWKNGKLKSETTVASDVPTAPNNVGPRTFPDYDSVARQAIKELPGGRKVFAGQADDPFFVDLGAIFDGINIRRATGNEGGGKDDVAGYNVHTIVLQVPESDVTVDREPVMSPDAANAVIGVWSSTDRGRLQVTNTDQAGIGGDVQVSRLGNPLVNELVIPLGRKDEFNRTQPSEDAERYGQFVVEPELAKLINALFPGANVPETDRTDIVTALLTGIPGFTQIGDSPAAADTLKVNLGVAPNPTPNRFGVLAGDNAGFPNGRRLADDVADIELRVVGGFLKGNKLPLGDGVDRNDREFQAEFPYVAFAHAGFDSDPKRAEPVHDPTPAQP